MRPLELTLEGFKSYRKAQTFNFETRTLFGIVGPTGSGKSSILEGLIFALYGKTPSLEAGTKRLINSQEEQARVRLIFAADDQAWEVVRIIRSKGTSQTVLRRLDGGAEPVTGDRSVTERIETIVGLDFDSFRSSVSLPQGEFDRFLKATPAERSRILKGIFRLERVDLLRDAAKARWQELAGEIAAHRSLLDALPDDAETLLEQAHRELAMARSLLTQVREELPLVLEAEQESRRSGQEIERLRKQRARAEAAMASLPAGEALRVLVDRHDRAGSSLAGAEQELEAARTALGQAEQDQERVLAATGGEVWLASVEAALKARDRAEQALAVSSSSGEELTQAHARAAARRGPAESRFRESQEQAVRLRRALEDLRQRHAAHLLRLDLAPGDPCPVCEQEVDAVPAPATVPALGDAQLELTGAESALEETRSELDRVRREVDLAEERMRLAEQDLARRRAELGDAADRLGGLAAGIDDLAAEVDRRRTAIAAAARAVAGARNALQAADTAERGARQDRDEAIRRTGEVSNLLNHACGVLGISAVAAGDQNLWEAAKQVLEEGTARLEDLQRQAAALESASRAAMETVARFRVRHRAAAGDQVSDVLARVNSEVARLESEAARLEEALRRRRELGSALEKLVERRLRFDRLIADFTDSKFTAFLLDAQRRLLSRIGSEKFHELTGHYTFDEEGQFQVFDERSGVTRSPDTLSGGETFLASLSLALALAEAVALEGGRLGCFFLDEGFGALDQESLDLALDGIESLAVPGRLIGLISHIPGVQARLDDLIVLERLGDGSTEVAQHEGPIGYASMLM